MSLVVKQAHTIRQTFLLISVNLWTRSLFISTGGWCSMERGLVHYGFAYLISHWYSMHGTACFIPDCRPCRLPKWQNTSDCQGPPSLSNIWCLHTCGVGDRAWSAGPYSTHGTYQLCSRQRRAEDQQEWQCSTPEKYKLTEQCTSWGTSCLGKTQSRYWHSPLKLNCKKFGNVCGKPSALQQFYAFQVPPFSFATIFVRV